MSAGVQVHADARDLSRALEASQRRVAAAMPAAMAKIAEHLAAAVSDQFESAGDGRWQELAESTLASRRKDGVGAQILVDTGRFAGSIEPDSGDAFAEAGTDVSYAVYHVSDEPRQVIPLRNPFDIHEDRIDEANEMLLADIAGALS